MVERTHGMPHVTMKEAKTRLTELVAAAEQGERVVITRHGKAAVELVPCKGAGGVRLSHIGGIKRRLGIERVVEAVPEDFDAPLPEDSLIRPID